MTKKIQWTDGMLHKLRMLYPDHTIGDIADELGISSPTVSAKARALGLKRSEDFNRKTFNGRYTFNKWRK